MNAIREKEKGGVIISDNALVDLIRDIVYEGRQSNTLEKPNTVRAIAKGCGYFIGEERVKASEWGSVIKPLRIIAMDRSDIEVPGKKLALEGRKLYDVKAFYEANGRKF